MCNDNALFFFVCSVHICDCASHIIFIECPVQCFLTVLCLILIVFFFLLLLFFGQQKDFIVYILFLIPGIWFLANVSENWQLQLGTFQIAIVQNYKGPYCWILGALSFAE